MVLGVDKCPWNPYITFVTTHNRTLMTTISLTSGELLDIISVLCDKEQSVYDENPHLSAYYLNIMQQFEEVSNRLEELPGEERVANLILAMP